MEKKLTTIEQFKQNTKKKDITEQQQEIVVNDINNGLWYTLQVYMNSELAVKNAIQRLKERYNLDDRITNILVPIKNVISISEKQRKENILKKAIYPGYVFIQIKNLDPFIESEIIKIPKVSKFIGLKNSPTILQKSEIDKILSLYNSPIETTHRITFATNDKVLIKEGEFENFKGYISSIDEQKQTATVMISIFGRDTEVKNVDFKKLEKLEN